jgi:hypothetical protein
MRTTPYVRAFLAQLARILGCSRPPRRTGWCPTRSPRCSRRGESCDSELRLPQMCGVERQGELDTSFRCSWGVGRDRREGRTIGEDEASRCLLHAAEAEDVPTIVPWLSRELLQRRIGVGWAALSTMPPSASSPSLAVAEVNRTKEPQSLRDLVRVFEKLAPLATQRVVVHVRPTRSHRMPAPLSRRRTYFRACSARALPFSTRPLEQGRNASSRRPPSRPRRVRMHAQQPFARGACAQAM